MLETWVCTMPRPYYLPAHPARCDGPQLEEKAKDLHYELSLCGHSFPMVDADGREVYAGFRHHLGKSYS